VEGAERNGRKYSVLAS